MNPYSSMIIHMSVFFSRQIKGKVKGSYSRMSLFQSDGGSRVTRQAEEGITQQASEVISCLCVFLKDDMNLSNGRRNLKKKRDLHNAFQIFKYITWGSVPGMSLWCFVHGHQRI